MKQKRNVVRLTESQLRQIVSESVKKVLKEASIRRGTTRVQSRPDYTDRFKYRTEENPYSNDTVMILAQRFEKRLGGEYEVSASDNPWRTDGHKETGSHRVDFNVVRKDFFINDKGQSADDVEFILKTAKQLFSKMQFVEKIFISNVESGYHHPSFNDSGPMMTTISVVFGHLDEPRKDMVPRTSFKKVGTTANSHPIYRATGYGDTNFKPLR